jgi:microcystin degradation protein MlrC
MRIGLGYLLQETNSFSPVETRIEDFHLVVGDALLSRWRGTRTEIGAFLDVLGPTGHEAVPLFAGWAMTAGLIGAETFEGMRKTLVGQVRDHGPYDALLLALHGAMCAEGTDDCDGVLLESIRAVVGPELPIVVTLDLHANVTRKISTHANAVIGYKAYPHTDMYETGEAAAQLLLRMLSGQVRPRTVMRKLPLIVPPENMQTTQGPMKEVLDTARGYQQGHPEILSVSVFGVQPWLDIEEMGCTTVAVVDDELSSGEECTRLAAQKFWDSRDKFEVGLMDPRQAIREAVATEGAPVVLADSADSPTAGAPGDSAELLRLLLEMAPDAPSLVWVRDPAAVEKAWGLRPGDSISTSLGGAFNPQQYEPVPVEGRLRSLSDGRFVFRGAYNHGMLNEMGRTAVIEAGAISIVVSEEAASMIGTEVFRSQGLEPKDHKIVVVKSANSFRSEYGPFMVKALMVDTPGLSSSNLRSLPYRRVSRPIHPLDNVEFAPSAATA